jgi:hypothetical protein
MESLVFVRTLAYIWVIWGVRYRMGDNLKVNWVKFVTLSHAVLLNSGMSAWHIHDHFYKVENFLQVSSC